MGAGVPPLIADTYAKIGFQHRWVVEQGPFIAKSRSRHPGLPLR
jgi:hypothetical protein